MMRELDAAQSTNRACSESSGPRIITEIETERLRRRTLEIASLQRHLKFADERSLAVRLYLSNQLAQRPNQSAQGLNELLPLA
jgi:hypothetical protein